jgi:hypothetical protein
VQQPHRARTTTSNQYDMGLERILDTSDGGQPAWPGWQPGVDLTPLEEKVVATAAAGEMVEVSGGSSNMETWEKERTVRAAVLRHLLVAVQWPVDEKGFGLRGVRISGRLDLRWAVVRCPLLLDYCPAFSALDHSIEPGRA